MYSIDSSIIIIICPLETLQKELNKILFEDKEKINKKMIE